jgi:DNA-binding transcriptional regulator YhcF (GntR family)
MSAINPPPYLRIVAALKLRMANGELRRGDRLPSIRELAREWNVALATAAKALTVLRHEGLVVVRARSGTVVAATAKTTQSQRRPGPHVSSDRDLTRERVIYTAIEIADREGLNAMSMRGVAAQLGVAAMSPYRFVDSKESLILLMTDAAYGEMPPPPKMATNWREQLTLSARTLWDLYTRHPWLAHVNALTRPLLLPNLMAHAEIVFDALAPCRLDPATVMHLHVLLYSYVHGIAIHLERKTQEEAATGLSDDAWMDTQVTSLAKLVMSGRYPAFAALIGNLDPGYELRLDELFEFGLKTLLDGFVVMIGR